MFFRYVLLYFIYSNLWGGEVLMRSTYYEDYEGRCYYCKRLNGRFYVDMGIKKRQLGVHNIFRFSVGQRLCQADFCFNINAVVCDCVRASAVTTTIDLDFSCL